MDWILSYAIAVCGFMAFFLYLGFRSWLIGVYRARVSAFVLRHLVYPYLYRRLKFLAPITRLRALLLVVYCAATFFYNAYKVDNVDQASARAGWLSVVNTIPLLVSGRLAMASKIFGMSINSVLVTHMTTGVMVAGQALAHVVLELRKAHLHLEEQIQLYGFMAAVAIMALISTLWLQRRFFELFVKSHASIAMFALAVTWLHLRSEHGTNWAYIALSLTLYVVMLLLQIFTVVFKHLVQRRCGARAYLSLLGKDVVKLTLHMEKAINARPGQFVYIWMAFSPLQTHPFMVVSEEDNTLTVLVQTQTGFSRKLKSNADVADAKTAYLAWIDGPYGDPPDFGQHQSIILVASGIGVAAHLSTLTELVSGYHDRSVKAKSIKLYWQVERADNREWIRDPWLDNLFTLDSESEILRVWMYEPQRDVKDKDPEYIVQDEYPQPSLQQNCIKWGKTGRCKQLLSNVAFMAQLETDIACATGNTIISVSANHHLRDETRKLCRYKLAETSTLVYHESDYQIQKPLRPWSLLSGKYRGPPDFAKSV